jgi:hypothetical protein
MYLNVLNKIGEFVNNTLDFIFYIIGKIIRVVLLALVSVFLFLGDIVLKLVDKLPAWFKNFIFVILVCIFYSAADIYGVSQVIGDMTKSVLAMISICGVNFLKRFVLCFITIESLYCVHTIHIFLCIAIFVCFCKIQGFSFVYLMINILVLVGELSLTNYNHRIRKSLYQELRNENSIQPGSIVPITRVEVSQEQIPETVAVSVETVEDTVDDCDQEKCTVCLGGMGTIETATGKLSVECKTLECKHVFHEKCIDKWISIKPNCPVCRNSLQGI